MTKRFFLAALTAVALTLGFTACSDDENEHSGKYEMTVSVHADEIGSDTEELAVICNAYRTAFGLGQLSENTEDETTTIQGNDSLECANTIKQLCVKAEKQLEGTTWTDRNIVSIRDIATNAAVYTHTYGAKAENGASIEHFDRAPGRQIPAVNTYCVADLCVDSRSSACYEWSELWRRNYLGHDLNCCAGGNYVYPSISVLDITNVYDLILCLKYMVGGIYVLNNESGGNPPETFEYDGCTYTIAKDANTGKYSFDLNHKAGGKYLYLYTTRADQTQKYLQAYNIKIWWDDDDCSDEYERRFFVKGLTLYRNGEIKLTHPNGIDLNQDAGGDYIYMIADFSNVYYDL